MFSGIGVAAVGVRLNLSNNNRNIRLSSDGKSSKLFTESIVFSCIFVAIVVQRFQIIYIGGGVGGRAIVEFIFRFAVVDIGGRLIRIVCGKILQSFFVVVFTENLIFAKIESVAHTKSLMKKNWIIGLYRIVLCFLVE